MILYVKNMVCDRCIMIVKQQVEHIGLNVTDISLGKVSIQPEPSATQLQSLSSAFQLLGFELIDKEKDQLVEQIKNEVINLVHYSDLSEINQSLVHMVADRLNKDQAYISRQFSSNEGVTIEKYIISQKIEKVKELLEYGDLNLNEIASKMGYSSSAHLSAQFKSVTGLSPTNYRSSSTQQRSPLDQL
ncbi:MAG: AraC family transcriptional regulator [Pedobacter sp.]|nr:MAG: AraC family transcriptional regulator [Pedobacter sp.]